MRVVAGKARSLQLKTVSGMETRPTTDLIKETLFNILAPYVSGAEFLDLFSGSGGIGIEAISRGAEYAYFVDNSRNAVKVIKDNLVHTHFLEQAEVIAADCISAIHILEKKHGAFDLIFMDPPYNKELEKEVLFALTDSSLVDENTLIVVESSLETSFDYVDVLPFSIDRIKEYKTNKHTFFRLLSDSPVHE